MKTRSALIILGLLLAACTAGPADDANSSLVVSVPAVVPNEQGVFTLVPSITFTNPTGQALAVWRAGADLLNVRIDYEVTEADGKVLPVLRSKLLFFGGGGRQMLASVHPGEAWTWKSHTALTYAVAGGRAYRIKAHLVIDGKEFDSRPTSFRVGP